MSLWFLLLVGCPKSSDTDSDTDIPTPATSCGAPLCISSAPDSFVEGRIIATTAAGSCFWGEGFASFPPPRVVVDGTTVLDAGGNGSTCLSIDSLPEHLPSGELWVEQGTDLDSDGMEDPGSAVQSNRLDLVTAPWVTELIGSGVVSGDPITVGLANIPGTVSWDLVSTGGCTLDVLSRAPIQAEVTPVWDSYGNDCQIWLQAGVTETGGTVPMPTDAPGFAVLPRLDWSCHAEVGEPCSLLGVGFGQTEEDASTPSGWSPTSAAQLRIEGTEYAPVAGDSWSQNQVRFTMPELPPGPHDAEIITASGQIAQASFVTQHWSRTGLAPPGDHSYDHEGALFSAVVGYTVQPTNALELREVAFAASVQGSGAVYVEGIAHVDLPFAAPFHLVTTSAADPCSRARATGVRDALDLGSADPRFVVGFRRQGQPAVIDWDGLPARSCEPAPMFEITGEEAPGRWTAFTDFEDGSTHPVMAGMARFDFGIDPPMPDALGRPGREVPLVALRDDLAGTTEILSAYGGPLVPLYGGPLTGRGTLHEAGEFVYVAGGEPGFDGILHELQWTGERTIPSPFPDLDPAQLPAFTGTSDGRLWALTIDDTGVGSIQIWDPTTSSWSEHSTVPASVMGADPATLTLDLSAHQVNDLAVYGGDPVVVVERPGPNGSIAQVIAWDGASWRDFGEPLGGVALSTFVCLSHASDDLPPGPDCPAGTSRFADNGWRDAPVDAFDPRLLATEDALYVRYATDDGTTKRGWVASRFDPSFTE